MAERHLFHIQMWKWFTPLTMALLASLGILAWSFFAWKNHIFLPVKVVQVSGDFDEVGEANLRKIILPYVEHGFFSVNLEALHQELMTQPWIADAVIWRVWPDHVIIELKEEKPVAIWDGQGYLNEKGELFAKNGQVAQKNLPVLSGSLQDKVLIYSMYKELNKIAKGIRLRFSALSFQPMQGWSGVMENRIEIKMGEDPLQKMRRFVKVYDQVIGQRAGNVKYVDMRYPNGMTIRWFTSNDGQG